MVREPEGGRRWSPTERSWGEYLDDMFLAGTGPFEGLKLRANVYVETFSCRGSEPWLMAEEAVAGTVRQVGKGRAWLLGTYAGHNGTAYADEDTRALICALLARCGISTSHEGKLQLRKRAIEGKEAWILTNPTADEVTERLDVSGWSTVQDLLGDPVERTGDHVDLTVKALDVRVLVLQK
jgi:hypothetical protein